MNISIISSKITITTIILALLTISCNSKKIEYTLQHKSINTSDSLITVQASYIQLSSMSPKVNRWMDSINKAIYNNIIERKDTIAKYSLADRVNFKESRPPYDLAIADTIYLSNNNIISILYTIYSFTGGAHGITQFIGYNYNIEQMKEITVNEIFKKDATPKINQLLADYFKDSYNCFTTKPTLQEVSAVNLAFESVVFTYQQYILGPYSCGPATITVPLEPLKDYIAVSLNLGL